MLRGLRHKRTAAAGVGVTRVPLRLTSSLEKVTRGLSALAFIPKVNLPLDSGLLPSS